MTRDGDLAFLLPQMPSVRGEQLLSDAFPRDRAKSEIAVFVGRESGALQGDELAVAYDLARQFKNLHGVAALTRAKQHPAEVLQRQQAGRARNRCSLSQRAVEAFNEAEARSTKRSGWTSGWPAIGPRRTPPRKRKPFHPRRCAATSDSQRRTTTARWSISSKANRTKRPPTSRTARELDPAFQNPSPLPFPEQAARLPLLDVWTWKDEVFGEKLTKPQARLMLLHLSNEFMAVDNIHVLDYSGRSWTGPGQRCWASAGNCSSAFRDRLPSAATCSEPRRTACEHGIVDGRAGRPHLEPCLSFASVGRHAPGDHFRLVGRGHVPRGAVDLGKPLAGLRVVDLQGVHHDQGVHRRHPVWLGDRLLPVHGGTVPRRPGARLGAPRSDRQSRARWARASVASALTTILGLATMFFAGFGKF